MALTAVAIPLTFSGGVDLKTDSKSVPTTQLLVLENGVFGKATTIAKRNGYDALSKAVDSGGEYGTPRALAARGDELVMATTDSFYSYRDSSATWSRVGPCASLVHTERAICATGTDQSMPDAATAAGVTVVAWEDSRGGVWWSVVELTSQRILRAAEQLAVGGTCPRVVHIGDRIVVLWLDAGGGQILAAPVNPENYLAPVTPVVVTADLSPTYPFYDVVRVDAGNASIAWNDAGTGGFRIGGVDSSGTLASSPPVVSYANPSQGPVSVAWIDATTISGDYVIGVAITAGGDVTAFVLDINDLSNVLSSGIVIDAVAVPVRIASTFTTDGVGAAQTVVPLVVWAEYAGIIERDNYIMYGSLLANNIAGPYATLRGHGLVSRGFTDGIDLATGAWISPNGACVFVAHDVPFFPYVALTRWFDIADALRTDRVTSGDLPGVPVPLSGVDSDPAVTCIGRHVVGTSDGVPVRGHLATVEQDADDVHVWRCPLLARQQVPIEPPGPLTTPAGAFTETGIQIVSVDFESPEAYQHAEFGRDLIVAGACPMRYDGDTIAELSFHTAPDWPIGSLLSSLTAGGDLTPSTTYLWQVCYVEVDASGEIHPGAMSVPIIVANASDTGTVALTLPTYRLTSKRRVRLEVYRAVGNDQSDDPPLYLVSSLDPSATGTNGYVLNDPTVDTVQFIDAMSDAVLITKPRAYTNSGVLSNDPGPLGHIVAASKDRLFWNDPTDPNIVRFSQTRRDGYGVEVSADLSIRVQQQGATSALGVLDDAVLVFAPGSISFFAGPGPLANPDFAPQIGFSPANIITGDVGCIAAQSLAVTPDRVLFQSARGIMQIDRSRQVAYVGANVEAYNAQRIVSADAVPGKTQVIFLTDEIGGRSLLYDYYYGQWSTFTNHEGLDAVSVGGVYHYVRANTADARVFKASATSYTDAGMEIRLHIETAWVKLLGYHQGLQKIWRALFLGTYKSAHKLRVRIAIDYQPGFDAYYDLDVDANYLPAVYGDGLYGAGPYGGDSDSVYQRRIHLDQKCQAIRFSIEDVTSGTPLGASFELTELLLEGGAVKRTANISTARSS